MHNIFPDLLGLPNVSVASYSRVEDSICLHIELTKNKTICPYCNSPTSEINQKRPILLRDLPAWGTVIYLKVERRQFYCKCCQRYSTERLEWASGQRRHTKRYESNIYERVKASTIEKVALRRKV